jgi:16S rRNA (cytosine1402-N4)-methyltransferase
MTNRGKDAEAGSSRQPYHIPVLLNEAVDALQIKPDGIYVDCTYGGGGHSAEILKRLGAHGRLLVFDQDPDARANLPVDPRIEFIPHNFRHLKRFLKLHQAEKVDGVLADLGVSSHQFDEASRGFSTRYDGPLDMRMDPAGPVTAASILRDYSWEALQQIFSAYGEITNARSLAIHLTEYRKHQPLQTIGQLKAGLQGFIKGNPHKYLAQLFQALRIEVNQEITALKELLEQLPDVLKPGGIAAIISFHSLEDRLVKQFFRDDQQETKPINPYSREERLKPFSLVNRKPIQPGEKEILQNPRSRSARLRVALKT